MAHAIEQTYGLCDSPCEQGLECARERKDQVVSDHKALDLGKCIKEGSA